MDATTVSGRLGDAGERPEEGGATAEPEPGGSRPLLGQTVVLVGGATGTGLEAARLVRAAGAEIILADGDRDRLGEAAEELAPLRSAVVDAHDPGRLGRFLDALPEPVDQVLVSAARSADMPVRDAELVRQQREVDDHLWLPIHVARAAVGQVRPGGSVVFTSATAGSPPGENTSLVRALTVARRALIADLAAEMAPVRINLIGGRRIDRPLSARLLGVTLMSGNDVRATLSIAHVVRPPDVARLAVHLMANTAITGATYDLDRGPATSAPEPAGSS